ISFTKSLAILHVSEVDTEDSGEYICEAKNDAGKDICSSVVTVKGVCDIQPHSLYLQTQCSVFWVKDDKPWLKNNKEMFSTKNYHASVRILNVEAADVGEYQCKAQNDVGSDTCICTVKLKGKVHCLLQCSQGCCIALPCEAL
uniref:Ig-like domain-containing protein n=1 Tax=Serinus canaria TaxID=9135 RepID=A0A8C9KQ18_SERCA